MLLKIMNQLVSVMLLPVSSLEETRNPMLHIQLHYREKKSEGIMLYYAIIQHKGEHYLHIEFFDKILKIEKNITMKEKNFSQCTKRQYPFYKEPPTNE